MGPTLALFIAVDNNEKANLDDRYAGYLAAGETIDTATQEVRAKEGIVFTAEYDSLSGRHYISRITVRDRVIRNIKITDDLPWYRQIF